MGAQPLADLRAVEVAGHRVIEQQQRGRVFLDESQRFLAAAALPAGEPGVFQRAHEDAAAEAFVVHDEDFRARSASLMGGIERARRGRVPPGGGFSVARRADVEDKHCQRQVDAIIEPGRRQRNPNPLYLL